MEQMDSAILPCKTKLVLPFKFNILPKIFRCIFVILLFLISVPAWAVDYGLVYSETANRAGSINLSSVEVGGDIYVRLEPVTNDIEQVRFYLDGSASPYKTENVAPYDLRGGSLSSAKPFDTTGLVDGVHSLRTEIDLGSGAPLNFDTSFTITNGGMLNQAPVLDPIADQNVQADGDLTFILSANDSDNDALTFFSNSLPAFVVLNDSGNGSSTLTFNPLSSDVGSYQVTISVSDGELGDNNTFTVVVEENATITYNLVYSNTPNRADSIVLSSMTVGDDIYVHLESEAAADIEQVRFYLDGSGSAYKVENIAPYDLEGGSLSSARPFDTTDLVDGVHSLRTEVDLGDGNQLSFDTQFVVANNEAEPSEPSLPSAPSSLGLVSTTQFSVTFNWVAPADNVPTTSYRIYRDDVELTNTALLSYTDSSLTASTQYQYSVSAFDDAGNESVKSQPLVVTTAAVTVGACGAQNGTAIAIPFNFVTPVDVGKYITLAATSAQVEYNRHSVNDAPDINWSRRYKDYKYGDGGAAINVWRLDSVPPNGTLYEGVTALSIDDVISDPDDLFYVPDTGFSGDDSFSYCVVDTTGQSNIATVAIQVVNASQYPMPYGIPDPGFGIDETAPADPSEWPGAERAGFYYIDSDHAQCNDTNNSYGFPNVPRCSIPGSGASVVAGGKMVLAPSVLPYPLRNSSWHLINFEGTQQNPSWLVGHDLGPAKPVIVPHPDKENTNVALRITGEYLRISGVVFDGLRLNHRGGGADEVVVRHSEFKNYYSTGGGGTTVGLSTEGNGVLAFNVYAHDNGVVESDGLSVERDIHAFVGSNQTGYWLLDIRCDENAGDCVQLTNNNTTENVYVGRMVAHSEGENCIDIKDYNRVVVSESDCWDLRQVQYGNSGGNAQNFYVNDEGVQQNYVYFLNNRSWDTGGANYAASNIGGRVYFIGNLSFASPSARGFYSGGGSGSRHIYFNTFVDSEVGIYHFGNGAALDRYFAGNIVDGALLYQTRLQSVTTVINVLDYNFYSDLGNFASGGSTPTVHNGLAAFNTATGLEENSIEGVDPGFTGAAIYDFSLTAGSNLRGVVPSGVISSLPLLIDLSNDLSVTFKDRAGTVRPQGSDYDAGALSYSP